jgi:hypothetical protein
MLQAFQQKPLAQFGAFLLENQAFHDKHIAK